MTLGGWFVIGIVVVLYVRSFLSKKEHVRQRTLIAVVATSILVPTYGPTEELVLALNGLALLAIVHALSRDSSPSVAQGVAPVTTGAFVVYMAVSESVGAGVGHILEAWVLSIMMILLVALAGRDVRESGMTVLKAFVVLLPFEVAIAASEQVVNSMRFWPRGDENFDLIDNRVNELMPSLAGRSIGTLGHPILLGTFAVIALVACVVLFHRTNCRRYALLGLLAPVVILLSGTRSAFIVMGIVFLIWIAMLPGRMRLFRIIGSGATIVVLLMFTESISEFIGFTGVEETSSYQHRNSIVASVPRLLTRPAEAVFFGSGGSSGGELFAQRIVQGTDGYYFFDNQYVRILAFAGVIGILLLAIAVLVALRKGDMPSRLVLLGMLVLMASYDVLTWNFSYMMLTLVLGASLGSLRASEGSYETVAPSLNVEGSLGEIGGAYRRAEAGSFDTSSLWRKPVEKRRDPSG